MSSGYAKKVRLSWVDPKRGWALMDLMGSSASSLGLLFKTSDGGKNWNELPFTPVSGEMLFTSPSLGWLLGGPRYKKLYRTNDAGKHWMEQMGAIPKGREGAENEVTAIEGSHVLLATRIVNEDRITLTDAAGN